MSPFIVIVFFVLPIAGLLAFYFAADIKLPEEKNLVPRLKMRCGGRTWGSAKIAGNGFANWPFMRVSFYDDFLVLAVMSGFGRNAFRLNYSELTSIELTAEGVKLSHNDSSLPNTIVIYRTELNRIREAVRLTETNRAVQR